MNNKVIEKEKGKMMSDDFGCYIFVFPEIYKVRDYLQHNPRVFSVQDLTKETLRSLV